MLGARNRHIRVGFVLAISLGVLTLVIFVVRRFLLPVFRFPMAAGPYVIGTMTYHLGRLHHWPGGAACDLVKNLAKKERPAL
jgi:hypothetical protein